MPVYLKCGVCNVKHCDASWSSTDFIISFYTGHYTARMSDFAIEDLNEIPVKIFFKKAFDPSQLLENVHFSVHAFPSLTGQILH